MTKKNLAVVIGLGLAAAAYGQNVISAKAGLVQYVEGRVLLEGNPLEIKYTQFPQVKDNQVLKTEEGRAEVLLSHASFLRLGENSSFRMVSSRLTDTRFEVLGGSVLVEVAELPKESQMSATVDGRTFSFHKNGLYRFDSEPASFRVYEGEAVVGDGRQSMTVRKGHLVSLDSKVLVAQRFDAKAGDELYRWASHRDSYLSMASVASARSIRDSGMSWLSGGMYFNPWYGMYTYVPMSGAFYSPFGFGFWSPGQVMYAVYPYSYGGGGGGGRRSSGSNANTTATHHDSNRGYDVGSRGTGYTGVSTSSSNSSSSSVSARGGGDVGGRGASSGGGSSSSGGGRH
jgi:hypothetical protein